jgi:hypothetical protein
MRGLENDLKWVPNDENNPQNPNFIPPEQRSWATSWISWLALWEE